MTPILLPLGLLGVAAADGPCDIYGTAGTPCVAAYSTVRALYGGYTGDLYQLAHLGSGATKVIGVKDGIADAALQDEFCPGPSDCVILRIYDQSLHSNHLDISPAGGAHAAPDKGANASALKFTISGRSVFGVYFEHGSGPGRAHSGTGYRCNNATAVAKGDEPETIYMVTAGKRYNAGCCFDFGNAEINSHDDGTGTMEAVYWGNASAKGWSKGGGNGPWVMADLENGVWAGSQTPTNPKNRPIVADFVTAMLKGDKENHFALKGGDAQHGRLGTLYDGVRPRLPGYNPMRKQGGIVLGTGGDNSDAAIGAFFEGVMTAGFTTDASDDEVQANIVAAGYGK